MAHTPLVTHPLFQHVFLPLWSISGSSQETNNGDQGQDHLTTGLLRPEKGSPKLVALKPIASENLDASESNSSTVNSSGALTMNYLSVQAQLETGHLWGHKENHEVNSSYSECQGPY